MQIADNYSLQNICGRTVLIPQGQSAIDGAKIISLNETAKWILENIKNGLSVKEMCDEAVNVFDSSEKDSDYIQDTIKSFVDGLEKQRLITGN